MLSFRIKYGVLKIPVEGIDLIQVSEVSLSLSHPSDPYWVFLPVGALPALSCIIATLYLTHPVCLGLFETDDGVIFIFGMTRTKTSMYV